MIAEIFRVIDLLLQKPEIEFCVVFSVPQTICWNCFEPAYFLRGSERIVGSRRTLAGGVQYVYTSFELWNNFPISAKAAANMKVLEDNAVPCILTFCDNR
jgi:hypothetical protein